MTAHELQRIYRELPAGSFVVHIAERTPIEVSHSDFASISPDGAVLSAWDAKRWFHHVDAISITRIQYRTPATHAEG
jgi:hypothetical protein